MLEVINLLPIKDTVLLLIKLVSQAIIVKTIDSKDTITTASNNNREFQVSSLQQIKRKLKVKVLSQIK